MGKHNIDLMVNAVDVDMCNRNILTSEEKNHTHCASLMDASVCNESFRSYYA